MPTTSQYPVWDLPTRLFHWLLVLAIFLSWLSHELEWIQVHLWSGYTVLVLVTFRIVWGFVGSEHSRFGDFVRPPAAILRYWRGEEAHAVGHNPAGAWSVLVLLALVLTQAASGLFNSDGLLFDGPLHYALDSRWADVLGELHEELFWAICGFAGLHVAAVLYYQFARRDRLINAMILGGGGGRKPPVPLWRAVLVVLLCSGLLALAVYFAPEPDLPW